MPLARCEPPAWRTRIASRGADERAAAAWLCRFWSFFVRELLGLRPFIYDTAARADLLLSSMQTYGPWGIVPHKAFDASEIPANDIDSNRCILPARTGSSPELSPG